MALFQDGNYSIFFYCNHYKTPCHYCYKNCELRALDEGLQEKALKAMKIGSKRKDDYEKKAKD